MNYAVVVAGRARRELEVIPSPAFEMIEEKMLSLGDTPRPPGCKKLKGSEATWRVRAGNYRILYQIDESRKTVTVIKLGHRSDVYR